MHLSLIAMSGSGKTYWANRLAEHGFRCLSCDEMIASRLKAELARPDGTMITMDEWMDVFSTDKYHILYLFFIL